MTYAYLVILIPSLLVFFAMTFLSSDDADGGDIADADTGSSGRSASLYSYLTFRNCINYLIGFGAGGALAQSAGAHPALAALCAVSGGAISALAMYKLMAGLYALSDEQKADVNEILGRQARVYIEIGANRSRRGKVLVTMKSAEREFNALTEHPQPLKIHTMVSIIGQEGDSLVVSPVTEKDSK